MSKRNFKFAIMGIAVFVLVVYYVSNRIYSIRGNSIMAVKIKNHVIYAETVLSQEKLERGLGLRDGICSSCGMLFKFQQAGEYSFWMKDMKFPLDLVWIHQGKIVHIEKNIQPSFIGTLDSPEKADAVLEMSAGKIEEFEVGLGDKVFF